MGNRKNAGKIALASLLGLTGTALAAGSGALASYTGHGYRQTLDEAMEWQKNHYDVSWYDELETEVYTVNSYDGYVLHAQICKNPVPTDRYVILTHGYTDNRFGMLKYMKMYLDRGYHCVIYDIRGHGENEKAVCTYSIREGKDLYEMIRDTRNRYPDLKVLGLHGESLGAASTASVMGYGMWAKSDGLGDTLPVDFAVADCGFADIENVLEGAMQHMIDKKTGGGTDAGKISPLTKALVKCSSAAFRIRYGYSYGQMKPITHLADNQVPMLFIHGLEDTFITPDNSRRMSKATAGYSEYRLIPGAGHAESAIRQPELYREYLYGFLDHVSERAGCEV